MVYLQLLPLLLLLVQPLNIEGKAFKTEDDESETSEIGDLFHSMQNFSFNVFNTLAKLDAGKKQDKANEKLLTMVSDLTNVVKAQSETIKEQGEKIQDQDQNIRDLRKSLDKRLRENDLKIEWALTDGTLAPHNTSNILKKIEDSLQMQREVHKFIFAKPGSCDEIDCGLAMGVKKIYPNVSNPIHVLCQQFSGGGWTVIQKRIDGSVDFFRGWEEYAEGFGDPAGEYWLGLRHIHALTSAQPMELYVGVTDFNGSSSYAKYAHFSVSSETDKFRLQIGTYSGNAGDKLTDANGEHFSTKDQENDRSIYHRSIMHHGAWWFKYDHHSHLNGRFTTVKVDNVKYMFWGRYIKSSVMMIRPSNFRP